MDLFIIDEDPSNMTEEDEVIDVDEVECDLEKIDIAEQERRLHFAEIEKHAEELKRKRQKPKQRPKPIPKKRKHKSILEMLQQSQL